MAPLTDTLCGITLDKRFVVTRGTESIKSYIAIDRLLAEPAPPNYSVPDGVTYNTAPAPTGPTGSSFYMRDVQALRPALDAGMVITKENVKRAASNLADMLQGGRNISLVDKETTILLRGMLLDNAEDTVGKEISTTIMKKLRTDKSDSITFSIPPDQYSMVERCDKGIVKFDLYGMPVMKVDVYKASQIPARKENTKNVYLDGSFRAVNDNRFDSYAERMFGSPLLASSVSAPAAAVGGDFRFLIASDPFAKGATNKGRGIIHALCTAVAALGTTAPFYIFVRYDIGSGEGQGGFDTFVPHLIVKCDGDEYLRAVKAAEKRKKVDSVGDDDDEKS